MPIFAAIKHGHFQQEGIRADLIFMRPNISITALVNGQVEFTTVHGPLSRVVNFRFVKEARSELSARK